MHFDLCWHQHMECELAGADDVGSHGRTTGVRPMNWLLLSQLRRWRERPFEVSEQWLQGRGGLWQLREREPQETISASASPYCLVRFCGWSMGVPWWSRYSSASVMVSCCS